MAQTTAPQQQNIADVDYGRPQLGAMSAADVNALAGQKAMLETHARDMHVLMDRKDEQIKALRKERGALRGKLAKAEAKLGKLAPTPPAPAVGVKITPEGIERLAPGATVTLGDVTYVGDADGNPVPQAEV